MVLGEAGQEKRRKTNPMGLRQADFDKLGKLTHRILWENAKKKRTSRGLVVSERKNAKGRNADAEERPEMEDTDFSSLTFKTKRNYKK